jgi:antitoxin component of MazEF toxin-antitoxin module
MRKNLIAIGNSLGIIIEKPILDLLGIDRESQLDMSTDGERLILEISKEQDRSKVIKATTRRIMKKNDSTLRKLAE